MIGIERLAIWRGQGNRSDSEDASKYERLFEGFLACLACKKHVLLQTRQADFYEC